MDKRAMKNEYRKVLETQINEKRLNQSIDLSITNKRVNSIKTPSNGLVPGLYNIASIGTRPVHRVAANNVREMHMSTHADAIEKSYEIPHLKYNPITNPIAMITSNPYILKEMNKYRSVGDAK